MAARYVAITRAEITDFFDRHLLHWEPAQVGEELCFDHTIHTGYKIRVATSLRIDGDKVRAKGSDAIRTYAFADAGQGLVKAEVTKRTVNWRKNLANRIDDVKQLALARIVDLGVRVSARAEAAQSDVEVRPNLRVAPIRPEIHNGTYTIKNRSTGGHRTLEVKTVLPDDSLPNNHFKNQNSGRRTVSLFTGRDNTSDYTMIGWLESNGIRMTKRFGEDRPTRAIAAMLFDLALNGEASPYATQYELLKEGRCLLCNRKLTTPESIESGIGPVCAGRI